MVYNLDSFKIDIFPGINDNPRNPTATKAGNGSQLIAHYNALVSIIQNTLNTLASTLQGANTRIDVLEDAIAELQNVSITLNAGIIEIKDSLSIIEEQITAINDVIPVLQEAANLINNITLQTETLSNQVSELTTLVNEIQNDLTYKNPEFYANSENEYTEYITDFESFSGLLNSQGILLGGLNYLTKFIKTEWTFYYTVNGTRYYIDVKFDSFYQSNNFRLSFETNNNSVEALNVVAFSNTDFSADLTLGTNNAINLSLVTTIYNDCYLCIYNKSDFNLGFIGQPITSRVQPSGAS